ncbi:MAG: phage holin family protein [Deltaproteobacteria bacterium]|nr:phage holin family protein [Deltaproteobacteria bacterium]
MSDLMRLALQFLVSGLSVLLVAALLPGIRVRKYSDAVWFSIVVAALNVLAYKVLGIITIPMAVLSLGIFAFFLNGALFLVAKKIVKGIEIDGCLIASIAALLVSLVNAALQAFLF